MVGSPAVWLGTHGFNRMGNGPGKDRQRLDVKRGGEKVRKEREGGWTVVIEGQLKHKISST